MNRELPMADRAARTSTSAALALMSLAGVAVSSCDADSGRPEPSSSADADALGHLPALRGDYFRVDSRAVGRPFHIYVRLPENYQADESARYPVVYVLDGDSLFPILAASHLFLTIDEGLPEAVVVGIAYGSFDPSINRRGFDFTAPGDNADPERGGAAAFHDFLESELIPRIETSYRADSSRRVLFGQSRGGSMVLYSAFTDPDLFWGRIASNPAFDPDRELFFSRAAPATRNDLGLVVTSGSRDREDLRSAALEWFAAWEAVEDKPWSLRTATIEGGTHSADSPNSYRAGMLWLFNRAQ
jgi:predicted alpha/beta superfamily hydrolase